MSDDDPRERIARAQEGLAAKIAELRRRETRVVAAIAPARYLGSPWLRLGLAVLVGYRLGRRKPRVVVESESTALALREPRRDSVIGGVIRAAAVTAATSLARHVVDKVIGELTKRLEPPSPAEPELEPDQTKR